MRGALLALLLSACASTSAPDAPPAALRGCWIERRGEDTVTMRWFPVEESTTWRGDQLFYRQGAEPDSQSFLISPTAGEREQFGWAVCPQGEPHGPPCLKLFFGDGRAVGEATDWMEIHATPEHLRFVLMWGGEKSVLFNGARDGCD